MAAELLALRDWLKGLGVTHVAMEATGVYWKAPYYVLEDDFELLLVNAAARQERARPQDRHARTPQWLCQLLECGLVRASFVPPKPIRRAARSDPLSQVADRRSANARPTGCTRCSRTPASSSSVVATEVLGVSGRHDARRAISGSRDPEVLADLAKGRLRKKIPALRAALEGDFQPHHALLARAHPRAHRLPRRDDRRDHGGGRGAIAPFQAKAERLDHDHRRRPDHRAGHPRRARPRHEPVPHRPPRRQLGEDLPRQR